MTFKSELTVYLIDGTRGQVVLIALTMAKEDQALPKQCARHLQAELVEHVSVRHDQ